MNKEVLGIITHINPKSLDETDSTIKHIGLELENQQVSIDNDYIRTTRGNSTLGNTRDKYTYVLNDNSEFRSIRCTELTRALTEKLYFREGLCYVKSNPVTKQITSNILMMLDPDKKESSALVGGVVPLINEAPGVNFLESSLVGESELGIKINNLYSKYFGDQNQKNGGSATEWFSKVNSTSVWSRIDLAEKPTIFPLITPGSDIYTDTLNFNGYIKHCVSPGLSGNVDIDVAYTVRKRDGSMVKKQGNVIFSAFRYNDNLELISDKFIQVINDEVQLEFMEGVVKLFPISMNVVECIINKCFLTYGK